MNPSPRIRCRCCVVLALAGAPALAGGDFRMFFVPAGDDPLDYPSGPTVVHAAAYRGGTLRMEVFLENAPEPVRILLLSHACEAAGGLAGSVVYEDGSAAVDQSRPDFIFFQILGAEIAVNGCGEGYGGDYARMAMGLSAGMDLVVTEPKYVYEFAVEVSTDADGTFTINFGGGTGAANVDSQGIPGLILEPLTLSFNCDPDEADCNDNGVLDACDIDDGTSKDCNNNGVPDECDLTAGTSGDCNGNDVPDECELDCNNNGIHDDCDVADGTSGDCNGNGVPDECEPDCDNNGVPDECEPDCDGDGLPDVCEVDCNGNRRPDDCEIADGIGEDCTANGILDECETDCNANGIADSCDVANGTSSDVDGNGIPDECAMRLFFVPAGKNPRDYPTGPTVVNAPGLQGRTISFEVFVASAPEPIRGIQVNFPCTADASAAISGSIDYVVGTATVDTARSDAFFAGCGNVSVAADHRCDPEFALVASSFNTNGCPIATIVPSYVGQFDLAVSTDAAGIFTVDFAFPGTLAINGGGQAVPGLVGDPLIISLACPPSSCVDVSDCTCEGLDGCTLARCIDGECVYSPKLAADVNRNAGVDIFDIFCVLDAFAGKFDLCTFEDTDVGGCQGDGKIDLLDIFAVLDGFEGTDACLSTCGHAVCVGSCTHP